MPLKQKKNQTFWFRTTFILLISVGVAIFVATQLYPNTPKIADESPTAIETSRTRPNIDNNATVPANVPRAPNVPMNTKVSNSLTTDPAVLPPLASPQSNEIPSAETTKTQTPVEKMTAEAKKSRDASADLTEFSGYFNTRLVPNPNEDASINGKKTDNATGDAYVASKGTEKPTNEAGGADAAGGR